MGGTSADHDPPAPEVAVSVPLPSFTVTVAADWLPASPVTKNPVAFSAMFTTLSVATASRFNASIPAESTITVNVAVAAS